MASELEAKLALALESRRQRGIYRELTAASHGLVDFSSNDYLSLSANPKLRDHLLRKLSESDASSILGSGGSRLLDGNQDCHVALEARLSNYFAADTALLFNSGFDANVGVFSVLPQPGDAILYDESIHASVHDGIRASRIQNSAFAFKHNSVSSLRSLLLRLLSDKPSLASGQNSIFIAVEALYSMGGDFAPIQEIVDLVSKVLPMRNGHIIVDEAHTTGVYGPGGRGIVSALHLEDRITVRLHTFGKALACSGGAHSGFTAMNSPAMGSCGHIISRSCRAGIPTNQSLSD
jgi:8-amino-7-oxononanoate synthase